MEIEKQMHKDMDAPAQAQVRTPTRTQAPPLTSIFPKYAVLAVILTILFVSWCVPRAWIWQEFLSCLHLQATYHAHGIRFTYYRDWRVVEHQNENSTPAPEDSQPSTSKSDLPGRLGAPKPGKAGFSNSQLPASTVNIEGPHGAVITFALFDPSYPKTLDTYADHMRIRFVAVLNDNTTMPHTGPIEPTVGQIHGANYDGFRYHFIAPSSMTSLTSRYEYFYELRAPTNKIMLTMQLPEQYIDSPEVQLILDTITLDGEINASQPALLK